MPGLPLQLRAVMAAFATLILAVVFSTAVIAAPPAATIREVDHLFAYLKSSGCKFNRNGAWSTAKEAVEHLKTKYDYLLERDLVTSTESFIERGASKSSVSGKPYLVQCGDTAAAESEEWFMAELLHYRASNADGR